MGLRERYYGIRFSGFGWTVHQHPSTSSVASTYVDHTCAVSRVGVGFDLPTLSQVAVVCLISITNSKSSCSRVSNFNYQLLGSHNDVSNVCFSCDGAADDVAQKGVMSIGMIGPNRHWALASPGVRVNVTCNQKRCNSRILSRLRVSASHWECVYHSHS